MFYFFPNFVFLCLEKPVLGGEFEEFQEIPRNSKENPGSSNPKKFQEIQRNMVSKKSVEYSLPGAVFSDLALPSRKKSQY